MVDGWRNESKKGIPIANIMLCTLANRTVEMESRGRDEKRDMVLIFC